MIHQENILSNRKSVQMIMDVHELIYYVIIMLDFLTKSSTNLRFQHLFSKIMMPNCNFWRLSTHGDSIRKSVEHWLNFLKIFIKFFVPGEKVNCRTLKYVVAAFTQSFFFHINSLYHHAAVLFILTSFSCNRNN